MKFTLFFLVLFITSLSGLAQNKEADSLIAVLTQINKDADKLPLLNEIASAYTTTSGQEVILYAEKAATLAKQLKSNAELGKAYVNLGNGNIILGNYDSAVNYFTEAKTVFELEFEKQPTEDLKKSLARTYGSIGIVSSEQSNYSRAFQYYIKSISIYEELQDTVMLSRLYNNVGVAYQSQTEYNQALSYFEKAKATQKKLDDPNIGITMTNIGNCYLKLKDYTKAIATFNEAESFVQNNPRALGEWNNSIGTYYYKMNTPIEANRHWEDAIIAFKSIDDKFGIADTYILRSELFLKQKNYDAAIKNADEALQLATQTQVLEQQRNAEKVLSGAYEKQNNLAQALIHYKKFTALNDTLANATNIRKGVQAEMNFEIEKKENIDRVIREQQAILQKEETKTRNIKYGLLAFSALILIGLGFLYNNRKQLKQRLTLEKELAEYEQKALHLQMNPHFIFNCLGAISGFIINNGTDHAIKYLSKFSKLMRLTLEYSQESLIPIGKEIESLQNYLELERLRFNDAFNFTITKSDAIEDAIAIPPLLIQPIVENAIIHGIVPKKIKGDINVSFFLKDDAIICEVTDNGIGIETSIVAKKESVQIHKSMALDIINKRLHMITKVTNKEASIRSFQIQNEHLNSEGTKVVISLPIQYID